MKQFVAKSNSGVLTCILIFLCTIVPGLQLLGAGAGREPLGPCSRKTGLVISEMLVNLRPPTNSLLLHFVELYNSNPYPEDISGYQLQGQFAFTFPSNTVIGPKAFLVVAYRPADLETFFGPIPNLIGPAPGASLLPGYLLALVDRDGTYLLKVPKLDLHANPKLVAADKAGHSMVLARPSYGERNPYAWDISTLLNGSPGWPEPEFEEPLQAVMINEVFATGTTNAPDFVELYNHSAAVVDVSGAYLSDSGSTLTKFRIPQGTIIPPGGFLSFDSVQLGFSLDAEGEPVYFSNTNATRVLDALTFERRAAGVSVGRVPDGGKCLYPLASRSPGTNNGNILIPEVGLNEVMFKPLAGGGNEYLELHNRGTNTIALGSWKIQGGVEFTFPTNAVISPGGYMVVANDLTNLVAHYPGVLSSTNAYGNLSGGLHNSGERIALLATEIQTNGTKRTTNFVVIDEVTYGHGGSWGNDSGGGGSSLELIDPRSDHRLAYNWADSDETAKAPWTTIEATGLVEGGQTHENEPIDDLQVMLLGAGECLLDKVEVFVAPKGPNLVANPGFESGLTGWVFQGAMVHSSLETSGGYQSQRSLHIRAHARGDTGANRIRCALTSPVQPGQLVTIRAKVRWLVGWPEVLLRLKGNYLEASGEQLVPPNAGTPGRRNSRAVTNAGPAISEVSHHPVMPAAGEPVVVKAQLHDPDGISRAILHYRLDLSTNLFSVIMRDDGLEGDTVAGDGIYSGSISGQASGVLVAFHVVATDAASLPATTRFPNGAPKREALVRFGEHITPSQFGSYRIWMTQATINEWTTREVLSNELLDGTFVYDNFRAVYNAGFRYAGSPNHQDFDSPMGSKQCHYSFDVPGDDQVLGTESFNKIHAPGNAPFDDPTIQTEQTAYWMAHEIGLPANYKRYVNFYVNGVRRGTLMEDTQVPNGDVLEAHWPTDPEGELFKLQPWYEFDNTTSGRMSFTNIHGCTLNNYTNAAGVKFTKDYRWNYMIRSAETSANSYKTVFELIDAANTPTNGFYQYNVESLVDVEQWMRTFALQRAVGNWDSFGSTAGQNTYAYKGKSNPWRLLIWDCEVVLGNSFSDGPTGDPLIKYNAQDPMLGRFYQYPAFQRAYWRALKEIANGPMTSSRVDPVLDAKYAAFVADGLSVQNPQGIKQWIAERRNYLLSQLAPLENVFTVDQPDSLTASNNLLVLTGTAPLEVSTITINSIHYPIEWKTLNQWSVTVALQSATNQLILRPLDRRGLLLSGLARTNRVIFTGPLLLPQDVVIINEVMFRPGTPKAGYIEVLNTATNFAFDMSDWLITQSSLTFPRNNAFTSIPAGTLLTNGQHFILAEDRSGFWKAYGAHVPVGATLSNSLAPGGAILSLSSTQSLVDQVLYEALPPRITPVNASMSVIDPTQDSGRVGNWDFSSAPTPAAPNAGRRTLAALPDLWLNEVAAAGSGLRDVSGEADPWIELFNSGTHVIDLSGYYLSDSYTNLVRWPFPAGAEIQPGQSLLVWADGQAQQTIPAEWHADFRLQAGGGAVALSRLQAGVPELVDYLNYSAASTNASYGAYPDGQSLKRITGLLPSPGTTNRAELKISINEIMLKNRNTLRDPADFAYDPWLELYNASEVDVNLEGFSLVHRYETNEVWFFPDGALLPGKGFLLVWADGQSNQGNVGQARFHTSWRMETEDVHVSLHDPAGNELSWMAIELAFNDQSIGRYPDGAPTVIFGLDPPSPGSSNQVRRFTLKLPPTQVVRAGQTIQFPVEIPEAPAPPHVLLFTLLGSPPSGATVNPTTGQFSWTPLPSQAGTNVLTFQVSNNGPPSFILKGSVSIVVLPAPEIVDVVRSSGNQVTVLWKTVLGKSYRVQFRDDLGEGTWEDLGPSLSGTGSILSFTDAAADLPQRFYRVVEVD